MIRASTTIIFFWQPPSIKENFPHLRHDVAQMGSYNLKWKRRVAFLLLLLEICWASTWFGAMLAYNLTPGADTHFEQSHFDSIIHVTAYPFVVATWIALVNGAKRKELADIRLLLFGFIFAGFSDARGPVHAALVLPHVGWEWPLFTAVASWAVALTGLEIIWFMWVTWSLWGNIGQEIADIWCGDRKKRSKRPREATQQPMAQSIRMSLLK